MEEKKEQHYLLLQHCYSASSSLPCIPCVYHVGGVSLMPSVTPSEKHAIFTEVQGFALAVETYVLATDCILGENGTSCVN